MTNHTDTAYALADALLAEYGAEPTIFTPGFDQNDALDVASVAVERGWRLAARQLEERGIVPEPVSARWFRSLDRFGLRPGYMWH